MALHITTAGQGPDLVLLHGWAMHSGVWSTVLPQLQQRFRVTLVDLPGHGHSDYSAQDWVEQCLAVAPPRASWLGWSLGGLLAMQAACRQPQRVTNLVCVAASPCFCQRPDWPEAMASTTLAGFAGQLQQDWQTTVNHFIALQMHGVDGAREHVRALNGQLLGAHNPDTNALLHGLRLLRDMDVRDCLDRLEVPAGFILGGKDRLVPPQLATALPAQVTVATLSAAGHAPFISHPREFMQQLQHLLAGAASVSA
jgi:pimeloyl-[acyl-carrier protein] methyl ester esterase